MSLVEVKNVSFTYPNGFVAVDGVSFKLEKGENIAIVGQNGAGKTTTVKMLNGLTKPTSGDIIVDGKNTKEYTTAQIARTVGYVFQNPDDQIFNNTVYKEIEYGLKRMKLPKEERERRINDICGTVGLLPFLKRKPGQLSGGQRQRVALARAMVKKPRVFLMDEPLSNLDAKLRNQMRTELIELHKQLGTTFVYVTHDQTEAMSMATDIVLMNKGVIQQHDSPLNIYSNPENLFTAQFIGNPTMNLFPCRRMEGLIDMPPGAETVGFRPSKVRLLEAGEEIREGDLVTGGPILTRELFGSEIIYRINAPFGVITFKTFNEEQLPVNMVVKVAVPVGSMYFFDAQERRLK